MIGVIATMSVQEGKAVAFEQVARELAAQVRANEPGILVYRLTKGRDHPNTYRFMEVYRDQTTAEQHSRTPYFAELFGKLQALLSKAPEIEVLDAIAL
jgi:quinol monooxygenase YgiN